VDVFRALPASIHAAVVRAYIRSAHCRAMSEDDMLEYVRPWVDEVGQAAFYQQISQFDRRYTDEVESQYSSVRCPTMILWGEEDRWIPIEVGRRLRERIPFARFQAVPNAGHLVHEDAPEAIVGAVIGFLSLAVRSH